MKGLCLVLITLLAASHGGCAATFDVFSGDGYTHDSHESSPTGQTFQREEYRVDATGTLQCFDTQRAIERERNVTKRYRRRNGLGKETYTATTFMDVAVGGLIGGILLGMCTRDDSELSCWSALSASPFAVDLVYSIVRRQTTLEPVLVSKRASSDRLAIGQPISDEPNQCASLAELRLGRADGPSDEMRLFEGASQPRVMAEVSLSVELSADFKVSFSDEALAAWVNDGLSSIWAVDRSGHAHPVFGLERCTILRSSSSRLPSGSSSRLDSDCPLPQSSP